MIKALAETPAVNHASPDNLRRTSNLLKLHHTDFMTSHFFFH